MKIIFNLIAMHMVEYNILSIFIGNNHSFNKWDTKKSPITKIYGVLTKFGHFVRATLKKKTILYSNEPRKKSQ